MNPYLKAIEIITTKGFAKESYEDDESGGFCMIGAVAGAVGTSPTSYHMNSRSGGVNLLTPLRPLIASLFPDRVPTEENKYTGSPADGIPYFNDMEETTKQDVIYVLAVAAANYQEAEDN